jgi:asparagine synthase (glutamine-hydrolysing)
MKAEAESVVSDADFEKRSERWPEGTPDTKEAHYIRGIFDGALS